MERLKKSRLDHSRRCSQEKQVEPVFSEQVAENSIWKSSLIYETKRVDACSGGEVNFRWNQNDIGEWMDFADEGMRLILWYPWS